MDPRVAPLEQITSELKARCTFLHLVTALIPNLLSDPDVSGFYRETGEWIDFAAEAEIRSKAEEILAKLDALVQLAGKTLPLRQPWWKIAAEHWERSRSGEFSFNNGVPCGWLAERFDCRRLHIPEDMPYHARIGVGHHAGNAAVEEDFLLRDAFFMLAKCESSLTLLESQRENLKLKSQLGKADYKRISTLNQNVATYGRFTVFGFFSFVECFINSVVEDFVSRTPALSAEKQELLRGKVNGRFMSTERKLELYPSLIRSDGVSPIRLRDRRGMPEPFKSFVTQLKPVRDSSTHFSKGKEPIVVSPQLWAERANKAAAVCIAVATEFWHACYPSRSLPRYLGCLDEEQHRSIAAKRAEVA